MEPRYSPAQLAALLPRILRLRDAEAGGALEALLAVFAREAQVVDDEISRLHDNSFIETCEPWAVPYLADLLGVRPLPAIEGLNLRPRVANTLGYRRRKGTVAMLEQLARDTTGWPAAAVEFFSRLATTQHLNHVRPTHFRTPDLRQPKLGDLAGGPFDPANHIADVRAIAGGRPRPNIPNVGLFLCRLAAYPLEQATPRPAGATKDGRYRFDPAGRDQPIFNPPRSESELAHLAEEINLPLPLRRRALYDDLEAIRAAQAAGTAYKPRWFGAAERPLRVFVRPQAADPLTEIDPARIVIADLSEPAVAIPEVWRRPPALQSYSKPDGSSVDLPIAVAVDPALGRLAFRAADDPAEVRVSYAWGFPGDCGAGPYDRREAIDALFAERPVTWQAGVAASTEIAPVAGEPIFRTLNDALAAWKAQPAAKKATALITVMDNLSYTEDLTGADAVSVPAGGLLAIVAADWPVIGSGPDAKRPLGTWAASGRRPHLAGNWEIKGTKPPAGGTGGILAMDGLLLEGGIKVLTGFLGRLRLAHTTLLPGSGELATTAGNAGLAVELTRCALGDVTIKVDGASLAATDSILAGNLAVTRGDANLSGVTVTGTTAAQTLSADATIFVDEVDVERRQTSCVRFSFVPDGSATSRRYRCQPDLALKENPTVAKASTLLRVTPQFTAVDPADPAWLQPGHGCPAEIARGAEDGNAMGSWHFLQDAARLEALGLSLDEYLCFGLEAGLITIN